MGLHTVIEPLRHDGNHYVAGDEVDLAPAPAEALIALGVVAAKPAAKPAAPRKRKESAPTDA